MSHFRALVEQGLVPHGTELQRWLSLFTASCCVLCIKLSMALLCINGRWRLVVQTVCFFGLVKCIVVLALEVVTKWNTWLIAIGQRNA